MEYKDIDNIKIMRILNVKGLNMKLKEKEVDNLNLFFHKNNNIETNDSISLSY